MLPLEKFLQKILVRKEVVEREIHVADVSIEKAKIYQLPDGSLFDSFAGYSSRLRLEFSISALHRVPL